MKVAVVSTPRTCSSTIAGMFEQRYNLTNKSEILSECETEQEALSVVDGFTTENNFVVKLTSTSFLSFPQVLNYSTFSWNIFDKIIITDRTNTLHQYASWLLLTYAQKNNKSKFQEIDPFIKNLFNSDFSNFLIKDSQLKNLRSTFNHFTGMKTYLLQQTNLPVCVITHEVLQTADYLTQVNQILNETIEPHHVINAKSSIDYTKFVVETNLEQRIQNLSND